MPTPYRALGAICQSGLGVIFPSSIHAFLGLPTGARNTWLNRPSCPRVSRPDAATGLNEQFVQTPRRTPSNTLRWKVVTPKCRCQFREDWVSRRTAGNGVRKPPLRFQSSWPLGSHQEAAPPAEAPRYLDCIGQFRCQGHPDG
jgi:hypothetical protein